MAKLSRKEVEYIARLARIELTAKEAGKFQTQLSSVLDYVSQLEMVDTREVEPTAQVIELENIKRKDETEDCDQETRKKMLRNVPEKDDDFVKVKAVFSGQN